MSGGIINIKNIYLQFNGALQVNYFTFYLGFLFILELRVGIVVYLIGSNRIQFGVNWEASILIPNYIQEKEHKLYNSLDANCDYAFSYNWVIRFSLVYIYVKEGYVN